MGRDIILLEGEDLRRLAKLVHYQEVHNIQQIHFKSEVDRRKQLKQSNACYKSALGLLEDVEKLIKEFVVGDDKTTLAHMIFENVKRSVNTSIQLLRSWKVRMECLGNATKHTQALINRLRVLDLQNPSAVANMYADLVRYDKAMVEFADEQSQFLVKYASKGYSKLATWMRNEEMTFGNLLERFKKKLGYEGPFKNLPREQQSQVFEEIMVAGGRKRALSAGVADVFGAAGVICLVATAGTMIWDIYTSDNKLLTAAHSAVEIGSALVGAMVARATVTAVLEVVGEEVAIVCGIPLGPVGEFILGCAVGYALSKLGGWIVDEIYSLIHKKQEDSHDTEPVPPPDTTKNHQGHVITPDARAIAYQIAHQKRRRLN